MLSISTVASGGLARIARVAARPPVPGMAASMTTTFGFSSAKSRMASSPLLASPTTARRDRLRGGDETLAHERVIVRQQNGDSDQSFEVGVLGVGR